MNDDFKKYLLKPDWEKPKKNKPALILIIVVVVLALGYINQPRPPQRERLFEIKCPPYWSNEERGAAIKSFKIFMNAFPILFSSYKKDIDSVKIDKTVLTEYGLTYDWMYEEYGWKQRYLVRVFINQNPIEIPNSCHAAGHALHYYYGKGRQTGYLISKGIFADPPCRMCTGKSMFFKHEGFENIVF